MKKKGSRKTGTRKHKGGYYSMSGAIAPGAVNWTRGSEMGEWSVSNRGGNAQYGSGKRKSKKTTMKRKGKKTMKGGNKFGGVFPSYMGTGERGLANYAPVSLRGTPGIAAGGKFNNFGAQPGSGYGSFIKAH